MNLGYGYRKQFYITINGERAMQEVKHASWFDDGLVPLDTAENNTVALDTPGAGKSNYLIGAEFHHIRAASPIQADHGLSVDLTEAGNIQTKAIKEKNETIMNGIQNAESDGCNSVGMGFGAKGIKLANDNVRYLYAQHSVGGASVLHGVDIYYIEDDS